MNDTTLILASASPRRRELMALTGLGIRETVLFPIVKPEGKQSPKNTDEQHNDAK